MPRDAEWVIRSATGSAADLHSLDLLGAPSSAWLLTPERPAAVLGSAQPLGAVDEAAARAQGIEVCRRRSGGGVVVVDPEVSIWVDVVVPVGHPRWEADVHRAFHWLGDAWADALSSVGVEADVHRGGPVDATLGRVVCFAGLGAGEVTIDGRKVVGISQRRDRRGARLQCIAHRRWDPSVTLSILGAAAGPRSDLERRLVDGVGALPRPDDVVAALLERLPVD